MKIPVEFEDFAPSHRWSYSKSYTSEYLTPSKCYYNVVRVFEMQGFGKDPLCEGQRK